MTGKEMIIYLCTFLFVLPQKEKIPKEKSQALNLRGYSERVFAKRQETRFAQTTCRSSRKNALSALRPSA